MKLQRLENRSETGWTEFGGCWARGEIRRQGDGWQDGEGRPVFPTLRNAAGEALSLQTAPVAWWPDGSVKWTRHIARAEQMGKVTDLTFDRGAQGEKHCSGEEPPAHAGESFTTPEKKNGLTITQDAKGWQVISPGLRLRIPMEGDSLLKDVQALNHVSRTADASVSRTAHEIDVPALEAAIPVLRLAHENREAGKTVRITVECTPRIQSRILEEQGPLQAVFRFDGVFLEQGVEKMPFRIRLYFREDGELAFDHTFFFQGDAETDRLAGMGIRFETRLSGRPWQRHIRYLTDQDLFHDMPTQLFFRLKRLDPALLAGQMRGETVPATPDLEEAASNLPQWDHFALTQDSAWHYGIHKWNGENVCAVEAMHGHRAPGTLAVSDPEKTFCLSLRDFWEKAPAALETERLSGETTACMAWFYAPEAEPFDFRHYAHRSYVEGCYEGFEYMMADPRGIAVTSRCSAKLLPGYAPDEALKDLNREIRKPPIYTPEPARLRGLEIFEPWSEARRDTEMERWIEDQIEKACDFYRREVEARGWYGLFNYGDFMHTYEASRHAWRYDVGGYAWDNTELAPTYWLWLQFLRTGDEQVYSLAEALSRHTADVDMYHFGPLKGLGSRHNVRHWGCPCKEPRVSMAGHHRPLYFLGCDRRIGDCLEDALGAEYALKSTGYYPQEDGTLSIRTGPDWSSLVSNWMCAWERTGEVKWAQKIRAGIDGIFAAPLKLTSGPAFTFEPDSGNMIYHGEEPATINMHLQACMAGPEIWMETARLLDSRELSDMVRENGLYFYLSPAEREARSGGKLQNRGFGSVIYSADMQAFAARETGDREAAREIWRKLLSLLYSAQQPEGFVPVAYGQRADGEALMEIPWISTNFTAQWCLKAIVCLDLIRDSLPKNLAELEKWLKERGPEGRMYGA